MDQNEKQDSCLAAGTKRFAVKRHHQLFERRGYPKKLNMNRKKILLRICSQFSRLFSKKFRNFLKNVS